VGLMAKRPLSVQLRPSSALHPATGSSACHDGSWSARRLSVGDLLVNQQRVSSDLANGLDRHHHPAVGRRPVDLGISASCVTAAVPRRRDRCSPSSSKRPIVMTLPRLDLSLIQGTVYDQWRQSVPNIVKVQNPAPPS